MKSLPKRGRSALGSLCGLALCIGSAVAVERPGGPGEPDVADLPAQPDVVQQDIAAEVQVRPHLGVWTVSADPIYAQHLGIAGGLMITGVVPDSPAEAVGVKQNDILLDVDGEPVATGRELQEIVFTADVGDEVTLTILRAGERITLKPTLGEVEQPKVAGRPVPPNDFPEVRDAHEMLFDLLRESGGLGGAGTGVGAADLFDQLLGQAGGGNGLDLNGLGAIPDAQKLMQELRQMQGRPGGVLDNGLNIVGSSSFQRSFADEQGTVRLTGSGDALSLTIIDRDGTVLFDGPYTTQADRDALPADLSDRVTTLEQRTGAIPAALDADKADPQGEIVQE